MTFVEIGIMKSGQFACLGNLQHLKNRFGKGYAIQIKTDANRSEFICTELRKLMPEIEIEGTQNIEFNASFLNSNVYRPTKWNDLL